MPIELGENLCRNVSYAKGALVAFPSRVSHKSMTVTLRMRAHVVHTHVQHIYIYIYKGKKIKWSRYRPGVAQRVGTGIALLFHGRSTRRGWMVSSTPRPHFTPRKDPVHILQEAGWATGPVWTGGKSSPHRDPIPGRPAGSSAAIPTELPGPHFSVLCGILHVF